MAIIISNTFTSHLSSSSRSLISPLNLINITTNHHYNKHNPTTSRANHINLNHIQLQHSGSLLCNASSSGNSHDYEAEQQRWLREEQRWLREEQRWLREEARWNVERQSLLLQIQHLQAELDHARARVSGNIDVDFVSTTYSKTLSEMVALLQGMVSDSTSRNQITDFKEDKFVGPEVNTPTAPIPPPTMAAVPPPRVTPVAESGGKEANDKSKEVKKLKKTTASLRMGAEGEEVRALQEALMNLGFYSGEEDMEFSSFSTGTDRAVKTWQASIGIREDGIVTDELLEKLYGPQLVQGSESSHTADIQKINEANGAVAKATEVQQTLVNKGPTDVGLNRPRVFLLGENRWEDSSRLTRGNDKQASEVNTRASATMCQTCRGEGRLLCMECDGTGEPNIEEQFMEWVEEGARCPYCEGRGYNVCDVCRGKPLP